MENLSVTDARLRLLEDNLKKVRDEIAETALKSGRDPREVKLMAVTKTVSVELINHAIACGVDLIGENKEMSDEAGSRRKTTSESLPLEKSTYSARY